MNTHKIGDLLAKVKRPGRVPQSEYLQNGDFPIIDQGKLPIAGYTNNPDVVIYTPLPVTVFGDHTRAVKLAKEPFACGADGTQLLYPNSESIDPLFFYYAVKNVNLSDYFYARHFKFLKEQEIQLPCFSTQTRIASILFAYDDLIENNQRRIWLLEQSARLLHKEWFVRLRFPGYQCVKIKSGTPDGWSKGTVGDFCNRKKAKYSINDEGLPLVDLARIRSRTLAVAESGVSSDLQTARIIFETDDVLFNSIRPYLHKVVLAPFKGITNTSVFVVRPTDVHYRAFTALLLSADFTVAYANQHTTGTKMPVVKWALVESMPVLIPAKTVLDQFEALVSPILAQIKSFYLYNRRLAQVRDSLLPRLMSGTMAV